MADPSRERDREATEEEGTQRLRRAAAGDEASVRWLFREHAALVHRTVSRVLGHQDGDVEDVVQQTFLAALAGASRFDGRSRLSTWIAGIAVRRALDQARARARRDRWSKVRERVGLGRPSGPPDARGTALALAERALATLRPDQRAVFVLHAVEGHTLKEISEMTGTGISTLHARLKAARARLDAFVEAAADGGDHGFE